MEFVADGNKSSVKVISCEDIDTIKEDILNRFASSFYDDGPESPLSFSESVLDSRSINRKSSLLSANTTNNKKVRKRKVQKKENKIRSERQTIRNERERHRKARLNAGFNVLRKTIVGENDKKSSDDRLTQLQTLKVASQYIANLTKLIKESDHQRWQQESQAHQMGQCYCYSCMDY